jgi:hypothetical protein
VWWSTGALAASRELCLTPPAPLRAAVVPLRVAVAVDTVARAARAAGASLLLLLLLLSVTNVATTFGIS